MQTTQAAAMIQASMWSNESQSDHVARCVIRSFDMSSDVNTCNIRC